MTFINRLIGQQIRAKCFRGKALIIYGARQVGKTTLIESMLPELETSVLKLNGDDTDVRENLTATNVTLLKRIIGKAKLLFIDEAQRIPDIGLVIKIIVDRIPDVQVIATGSSSFELLQTIQEPLTDRAWYFKLFPLSFKELSEHGSLLDEKRELKARLIFGSYPEIVTNPGQEQDLLRLLTGAYLYRDLNTLQTVARSDLLENITKALALQVGGEVSTSEIAQLVGADRLTVEKYIGLLEKAFVIFQLPALSRNVRNEIKKGRKIYFVDNGIRNATINNFAQLDSRTDIGALWENYCVSERYKLLQYSGYPRSHYFWRTTQQQKIDLIEENDKTELKVFKFKWNIRKQGKFSKTFLSAYNVTEQRIITPQNYEEFLLEV
ncbi:ATP-binding protein [bacterium]|nr:ATP-binding protein [bacterium]